MPREFSDPYTYPGSDVLKNIPGIRDAAKLDAFEYGAVALRSGQLRAQPIVGRYDLAHLQAIHKHLFQDVYQWAGEIRTVNISKNDSRFAQVAFIESAVVKTAADLARENHLQGLDKPAFVARLAYHFAELNAIHPFREGNGRATREFMDQLARGAGFQLDQTRIEQDRSEWILASRLSVVGELSAVERILREAIRPARAVAFERDPPAAAMAKHPELRSAFLTMKAAEAYAAEAIKDPAAKLAFVAQTKAQVQSTLDNGKLVAEPALKDRGKDRER